MEMIVLWFNLHSWWHLGPSFCKIKQWRKKFVVTFICVKCWSHSIFVFSHCTRLLLVVIRDKRKWELNYSILRNWKPKLHLLSSFASPPPSPLPPILLDRCLMILLTCIFFISDWRNWLATPVSIHGLQMADWLFILCNCDQCSCGDLCILFT